MHHFLKLSLCTVMHSKQVIVLRTASILIRIKESMLIRIKAVRITI